MKNPRGIRKISALAAGSVLALGAVACSGGSDDAGDGPSTVDASDGGGAGDDAASDSGGAGSGSDDGGAAADESSQSSGQFGPDTDLRTDAPPVTAEDAVAAARNEVGDGTLHAVELDFDEKAEAWQWDVKILAGTTDHKVVIDAVSGEVVTDETETTDDQEKAIDLTSPMTYDEASDLATAKVDGELRGWKLEYDDGMVQYQFDVDSDGNEQEVTVDADSGAVTVDD